MSYNLLSGSIEFIGAELGLIEDIVNTHGTQTVNGAKTFTNITASATTGAGLVVAGNLEIDNKIVHTGDSDTSFELQTDLAKILVGGVNALKLESQPGAGTKVVEVNPAGNDLDFKVRAAGNSPPVGMTLDANHRSFQIGDITNNPQSSDALFHITSSYHTGSLFSVGEIKNPIFAVSGSDGSYANWRVKVSGALHTDNTIVSAGIITSSAGFQGQLLNMKDGLEYIDDGGEKKLSVAVSSLGINAGLNRTANGIGLSVTGLTEEGSINTDSTQPDWILIVDNDGAGAYANKKQKLSTVLANTAKSSMSNNGVSAGGGIYQPFQSFAADARTAQFRSLTTPSGKLLTITGTGDEATIEQVEQPLVTKLTSSHAQMLGHTTIDHLTSSNIRFNLDGGRDWHFAQESSGPGTGLRLRSEAGKDFHIDATATIYRNYNGASEIMRVEPANGKVGIGTSSPSVMCEIAGPALAQELTASYGITAPYLTGTLATTAQPNLQSAPNLVAVGTIAALSATTLSLNGVSLSATSTELNLMDASATPPASGAWVGMSRWAKGVYDTSFGAHGVMNTATTLGCELPDNAIIVGGVIDVVTGFASTGSDAATIAIHVENADDIVAAIAVSHGDNAWDGGLHPVVPSRTSPIKTTTSNRDITVTTGASQDLSAGKMIIWLEYIVSD